MEVETVCAPELKRAGSDCVGNLRQGKGLLQLHRIKPSFPWLKEKES